MNTPDSTVAASLHKSHNFERWIILLQLVIIAILVFKFRLSTQIEKDVIESRTKAEITERLTIEFMTKTVERWEKLKLDNPEVKVPAVALPIATP